MIKNKKIIISSILLLLCFAGAYIWYYPTDQLETVESVEQVIVPDIIEEVTVSELDLPELLPELKDPPLPQVNEQDVTVITVKEPVTADIINKKLNLVTSELNTLQTLPGLYSTANHSVEAKVDTKKKKTAPAPEVLAAFEAETGISSKTIQKAMNPQQH